MILKSKPQRFNSQRRAVMLSALAAGSVPFSAAIASQTTYPELSLSLYNLHTTERLDATFWVGGDYDKAALDDINYFFRDHRTNGIKEIDPRLLSILYLVNNKVGKPSNPYSVISGYRSEETNRKLAKINSGVAKNSYHVKGRAVDIRLPGTETKHLKEAGLALRVGGVGYYPNSNFVHLDTGPHRVW